MNRSVTRTHNYVPPVATTLEHGSLAAEEDRSEAPLGVPSQSMLLPKGGVNWKAARGRLPPSRAIWNFLTKSRFLLFVAAGVIVFLVWDGLRGASGEVQK